MTRDPVEEAGLESIPASDAPAWGQAAAAAKEDDVPSEQARLAPKEDALLASQTNTAKPASGRIHPAINKEQP